MDDDLRCMRTTLSIVREAAQLCTDDGVRLHLLAERAANGPVDTPNMAHDELLHLRKQVAHLVAKRNAILAERVHAQALAEAPAPAPAAEPEEEGAEAPKADDDAMVLEAPAAPEAPQDVAQKVSSSEPLIFGVPHELVHGYHKCAETLRRRGEGLLANQALNELGDAHLLLDAPHSALICWCDALDAMFGSYKLLSKWREHAELNPAAPDDVTAAAARARGEPVMSLAPLLHTYGARTCLLGGVVAAKIARHGCVTSAAKRLSASIISARCFAALMCDAPAAHPLPFPDATVALARYVPTEILSAFPGLFDDAQWICNDAHDACDAALFAVSVLLESGLACECHGALAVLHHMTRHVTHSAAHARQSDILRANTLSELGFVDASYDVLLHLIFHVGYPSSSGGSEGGIFASDDGVAKADERAALVAAIDATLTEAGQEKGDAPLAFVSAEAPGSRSNARATALIAACASKLVTPDASSDARFAWVATFGARDALRLCLAAGKWLLHVGALPALDVWCAENVKAARAEGLLPLSPELAEGEDEVASLAPHLGGSANCVVSASAVASSGVVQLRTLHEEAIASADADTPTKIEFVDLLSGGLLLLAEAHRAAGAHSISLACASEASRVVAEHHAPPEDGLGEARAGSYGDGHTFHGYVVDSLAASTPRTASSARAVAPAGLRFVRAETLCCQALRSLGRLPEARTRIAAAVTACESLRDSRGKAKLQLLGPSLDAAEGHLDRALLALIDAPINSWCTYNIEHVDVAVFSLGCV